MKINKDKIRKAAKRGRFLAQLWEGVISTPISFALFFVAALFMQQFFGFGVGMYDPAFWQALILTSGIILGMNLLVFYMKYMNFRGLFRYWLTKSKEDFDLITPLQRLIILLFIYVFLFSVIVIVFKSLV